jgi:hypothetical protein
MNTAQPFSRVAGTGGQSKSLGLAILFFFSC